MSKKLILCSECRKTIAHGDKALFVDQSSSRPFCSEKCIMDYHAPHMESFEREEIERRESVGAELDEGLAPMYQNHEYFQKALYSPDEVWIAKNGIGEEFYTHIARVNKEKNPFTYIVVCSYFDNEPSFVYFKCLTKNENLVESYREQSLLDPSELVKSKPAEEEEEALKEDEIKLPPEVMESLELKKSEYLANLLQIRSDEDIPFERFTEYDEYTSKSLEDPDEIFTREDEAGDKIRTYIKSFKVSGQVFYYVVVCISVPIKELDNQEALLPVIGFPSTDQALYKEYAIGERYSDIIKN